MQIGGFQIGIEKSARGKVVVCRSIADGWSVRWGDDMLMFGTVLSLAEREDAHEYLHSLLTVMFIATTYPHDMVSLVNRNEMPFMTGFSELIHRQNEYEASLKPQPTEEENQKSLDELKHIAEVAEEMMKIKEETDGEEKVHAEGA